MFNTVNDLSTNIGINNINVNNNSGIGAINCLKIYLQLISNLGKIVI